MRAMRRRLVKGMLGLGLVGGMYYGLKSCGSDDIPVSEKEMQEKIPEKVKEKSFAEQLEERVREKSARPAAYMALLKEGLSRNEEEFIAYLGERLTAGDEGTIRTLNRLYDTVTTAVASKGHPRDGNNVPPLAELELRLNLVGDSYYASLFQKGTGREFVVQEKDVFGTKTLNLEYYSSTREQVDKREPKQQLIGMYKIKPGGK